MIKRLIKVIVNGTAYEVEIGDLSSTPATVLVDGKPYEVEIQTVSAAEEGKAAQPTIKPIALEPAARKPGEKANSVLPGADADKVVSAPMPGTIVNIVAKVGSNVCRGDPLCALEAMKMKNAIRSPRAGVIAAVEVTEGQKVAYGDVLIRYA